LSTKLKTPMRKGMKYAVKFYVCLSEGSKYAANNVAANFSKKQWSINENKSIIGESSVLDVENVIFNAMFGWDQVCGVYTAKGGEKFLTLGNFSSNADTKNERMKKPKGFTGKQVVSSYYYIDDISVTLIDDESECKCESDKAEVASTVYSSAPVNPEGMTPEMVAKFSVIYFASNKGTIEAGQEGHLDNIADIMLSNPAYKLTLKIHLDTDEVANPKALGLDKIRGESVKKYLKTKGIDGGRITFNLMKDTQPKSKGVTDLSKAKNRRVKFVLSK
jgi:outer membrane protein OmpA-like peptidoglycan-associated protein